MKPQIYLTPTEKAEGEYRSVGNGRHVELKKKSFLKIMKVCQCGQLFTEVLIIKRIKNYRIFSA